jgi:hypothetical protein
MLAHLRLPTLLVSLGLLLAVAAGSLALHPTPVAAQPAPGENVSQYCRRINDLDSSHGGCVSLTTNGNDAAAAADACRDPEFWPLLAELTGQPITNHGQCMRALK